MTIHDQAGAANPGSASSPSVQPEQIAGMSGKELLQAAIDGRLPQAAIATTLSHRLVEVGDGVAVSRATRGRTC
ncbi:MAG: hypothetical protein ABSD75_13225 [Terriglobales bacterium]|jgi:hypothetical protein